MKAIRKLHLYLSVFFAPLLLFFIGTGWYQTVNTQRNKLLGEQDTFVSRLTSVHVDQIYPSNTGTGEYSTLLFKTLVVSMCVALLVTIALGIILAFKTSRRAWLVITCLLFGACLPVVFLWLGQPR